MIEKNTPKRTIIKASAGTGKTYRLALEYLGKLLQGESYSEILFITFTRAATGELRDRIFEFLEEIITSLEKNENSDLLDNLKNLFGDLDLSLTRMRSIQRELLLNKDKLKIFTIDSFCGLIFKKTIAPYLGVYFYSMTTPSDEERIYKEIFKKILQGKGFDSLFNFLLATGNRNVNKYIDIIKKVSSDRWIFNSLKLKEYKNDYSDLTSSLKNKLEILIGEYIQTILLAVSSKKDEENLAKYLSQPGKVLFEKLGVSSGNTLTLSSIDILAILEGLDEKFKGPLKGFKFFDGRKIRKEPGPKLNELTDEIVEVYLDYIFYTKILFFEQGVIEFANEVDRFYFGIKVRERSFSFSDITNYTSHYLYKEDLKLVEGGVVTDEFFDIIGGKITTLFLDEAQDTGVNQWKAIEPLAKKVDTFIVVGDDKQSIYSWRGGDKKLFLSFKDTLSASEESLPTSYRSEKVVIDFINYYFKEISNNYDNWNYTSVKCAKESKDSGFLGLLTITNPEESLKESIAKDIKERFTRYSDIGIVARKIKDLNEIGEALTKEGIPFITQRSLSLVEHPGVASVITLLEFISTRDITSLMEFMRSPLCDIDDPSMVSIFKRKDEILKFLFGDLDLSLSKTREVLDSNIVEKEEIFEVSKDKEGINLVDEVIEKIDEVEEFFTSEYLLTILTAIKCIIEIPFPITLKKIIEDFNVFNAFSAPRDIKNINLLMDIGYRFNTLEDLLDYLRESRDSEELRQLGIEDLESVILMTIHGSKGLEFHTEYFLLKEKADPYKPFGFTFDGGERINLFTQFNEGHSTIVDYLFLSSKYEKYIKENPVYLHNKDIFEDELVNLLYVGLTRASSNLIICLEPSIKKGKDPVINPLKNPSTLPLLSYFNITSEELFERGLVEKGTLSPYKVTEEIVEGSHISPTILKEYLVDSKKVDIEESDNSGATTTEMEFKRKVGLAAHYFLEVLEDNTKDGIATARKLTYSKYGNILGESLIDEVFSRLHIFVDKHPYLFDERFEVYKEFEIVEDVVKDGVTYKRKHIIDRLHVDHSSGEIIIFDYKSGVTMEDSQLDRYRDIISKKLVEENLVGKYQVPKTKFLEIL